MDPPHEGTKVKVSHGVVAGVSEGSKTPGLHPCKPGETAHHITPGCRLRSLRSLRPTLARSRHLLRSTSANAAPVLRVRQPETLYESRQKQKRRRICAAKEAKTSLPRGVQWNILAGRRFGN